MSLALVTGRLKKARERIEGAGVFEVEGPVIGEAVAPDELAAIEARLGIELPRTLRDFYTRVGGSYRWGWSAPFADGLLSLVDARALHAHVVLRDRGRVTLLRITDDGAGGGYVLDLRERGFNERISHRDPEGEVRGVSPSFANFFAVWAEQAFARDRESEGAKAIATLVKSGRLPAKLPAPALAPRAKPQPREKRAALVFDSEATELLADDRGLSKLPEDIGTYQRLETLHLERNRIAALPRSFARLAALKKLNLSGNPLGTPETLAILAKLPSLRWLMMWDCFEGVLPAEIGRLRAIDVLSLKHNALTSVPDTIGELATLTELTLSDNRITRLPDSIRKLARLKWLFVERNPLDLACTFEQLAGLPKLERLVFSAERDIPSSISALRHLTHVFVCAPTGSTAGRKLKKLLPDAKITKHDA